MTEVLLDSRVTELIMSEKFVRRHKFKRMKLERLVLWQLLDTKSNNYTSK